MTVPITVVGGYLGAGKTTLINRALMLGTADALGDLAVLVNDFGSVNVDEALIRSRSKDPNVIGLVGGCVCCAVQDDLGAALEKVKAFGVRHVLIEASGVAAPARVSSYGRDWPGYRDRGCLVVVDRATLAARLADKYVGRLVRRQIAEAGALALHSAGRVPADAIAPAVPAWDASDPELLALILDPQRPLPARAATEHGADVAEFAAVTLHQRRTMARAALDAWLAALPAGIARVKGFVATDAGCVLVQGAGAGIEVEAAGADERAALVLIAPARVLGRGALEALAGPDWRVAG